MKMLQTKFKKIVIVWPFLIFILIGCVSMENRADTDPYLWLEEVRGTKALDFATQQNAISSGKFKTDVRFKQIEKEVSNIILAKDRVPFPSKIRQGQVYNFWQDEQNPKGLWRRTRIEEYKKPQPQWEILLNLDELGRNEKIAWVFKNDHCLEPAGDKCILQLSKDGRDASVFREFDLKTKTFVKDGFIVPEGKNDVHWLDENHLLVGADVGKDPWTESGYPRTLRLWTRGETLDNSKLIFEADKKDNGVWAWVVNAPESNYVFLGRHLGFFEREVHWMDKSGKLTKLNLPLKMEIEGVINGQLLVQLQEDWKSWKTDTLLAVDIQALLKDQIKAEVLFTPSSSEFLQSVGVTRSKIYLLTLKNVMSQLYQLERKDNAWTSIPINDQPHRSMDLSWYSRNEEDIYYYVQGFLQPAQLEVYDGRKTLVLKTAPHRFDEKNMMVEQFWAVSADGVRIPYSVIHSKNWKLDSNNPTLLYGYGGFKVSQKPSYLTLAGKLWLEKGGVFVLANIRGGAEFGNNWHQSAILQNKQKSYDDFIAIAEDLMARKITSAKKLGIKGGSNGGLLVGAVTMQRPELFNAVICSVPLLDMLRYHKLLAGYSWMAEYGNPDIPAERDVILKYSPYQNVRKNKTYPVIFFNTSTADDRVHPGHARKMAAEMLDMGHPVLYFENIEGGHGGAADPIQQVRIASFEYIYLMQQLMDH